MNTLQINAFQNMTNMHDRNQEATIYINNLDTNVTEDILLELFIQCGPIVSIHLPKDRVSGEHNGFGFLEFRNEDDCEYAVKIMNQIKLFGKPIKLNKSSQDKRSQEVGANLFIGNLAEEIDEKILKDIFQVYGNIILIRISRDETSKSKHYGFVNFDKFDSSDNAIKELNGKYLYGKQLKVEYALRNGSKTERHGSLAERILAANKNNMGSLVGVNESKIQANIEIKENLGIVMNKVNSNNSIPITNNFPHLINNPTTFPNFPNFPPMPNIPPNMNNMTQPNKVVFPAYPVNN